MSEWDCYLISQRKVVHDAICSRSSWTLNKSQAKLFMYMHFVWLLEQTSSLKLYSIF